MRWPFRRPAVTDPPSSPVAPRLKVLLACLVGSAAAITAISAVLLWPPHPHPTTPLGLSNHVSPYRGTVLVVRNYPCLDVLGGASADLPTSTSSPPAPECQTAQVLMHSGPDKGQVESVDQAGEAGIPTLSVGDRVLLVRSAESGAPVTYGFYDFQRSSPLAVLALAFAIIVVLVGRWRGIGALVGLGITWLVMIRFVLPAILEGKDPVSVSLVGSAIIVLVVLFVAHGVNARRPPPCWGRWPVWWSST